MATAGDDAQYFGSLFESVTGQTTITEAQYVDVPVRLENVAVEQTVSESLAISGPSDGLEDVIDEPERSS